MGGYEAEAAAHERIQDTYRAIAELVGGRADQVALFDNSTHAWNAAFYSVPLKPGTASSPAAPSTAAACWPTGRWPGARGPRSSWFPTTPAARSTWTRFAHSSTTGPGSSGSRGCRPAVAWSTLQPRSGASHARPARSTCWTPRQAVGQLPIDVEELGCDMLTGTGRKFLRGPRGTGFLWVSDRALERLEPSSSRSPPRLGWRSRLTWAAGARRFETWENSYVNVLGLGAASNRPSTSAWMRSRAAQRALGRRLRDQLGELPRRRRPRPRRRHSARSSPPRCRPERRRRCGRAARPINVSTTVPERQPAGHRGPRGPSARAALPALLQHRDRDRPGHRRRRRAGSALLGHLL